MLEFNYAKHSKNIPENNAKNIPENNAKKKQASVFSDKKTPLIPK